MGWGGLYVFGFFGCVQISGYKYIIKSYYVCPFGQTPPGLENIYYINILSQGTDGFNNILFLVILDTPGFSCVVEIAYLSIFIYRIYTFCLL